MELKEHDRMLTGYYRMHGYDLKIGIPARERLECFGLKFVADELEAQGSYPDWDGPLLLPMEGYPYGGGALETESERD